jgi:aryl-alcohol dehydrogenase-like predicted oxidoreductase
MGNNNKIGLGTVQFGMQYGVSNTMGKTPVTEVARILEYAKKEGLRYIDTAEAYGCSEKVLGKNDLSGFRIISKFLPPQKKSSIQDTLANSLKNLKVDNLYGYLAHRPQNVLEDPKQWDELKKIKDQGKVKKIGYSLNDPKELETLLDRKMIPDIVQVPYNFLDNRFRDNLIELKRLGCEIHSRSSFLQGIFFMKKESLSDYFNEIKPTIQSLQIEHKERLSGALLRFVMDLSFIDIVVMGVENIDHLKQNLQNIKEAKQITVPRPQVSDKILMPSLWP